MKKRTIVGLDIGTSSLKATIADASDGNIVQNLHFGYKGLQELAPGVVPADFYVAAVTNALRRISIDWDIASIAVTSQMYSICEDTPAGTVVHQWNSLWENPPAVDPAIERHLLASGCQNDSIFGAYKVAAANEREKRNFLPYGLKEHLIESMTGELATDYATASSIGLFDVRNRRWNMEFINLLKLDASKLPEAVLAHTVVGKLRPGLFPGCENSILVPGLGDGPSASFACRDLSDFCGNLGTSMAARVFTKEPDISKESGLWNFAVDDETYLSGGISPNACQIFTWIDKMGWPLFPEINASNGVIFLPWLSGERVPYWSSDLKGTFLGLKLGDDPSAISSAVIKAVGFTFVRIAKSLLPFIDAGQPLILGGGGIKRAALVDVIAGCLDCDIMLLGNSDYLYSCGAAKSAGLGLGAEVRINNEVSRVLRPTYRFAGEYENWLSWADKVAGLY